MRAAGSKWGRLVAASATLTLIGLGTLPAAASTNTADQNAEATASVPVNYSCFVTFPGGETTVPFSLTFTTTAPQTVKPYKNFKVVLDSQSWTPDPQFNQEVRNVKVKYKLPDNAKLSEYKLKGGTNLGPTPPTVEIDQGAKTLSLTAPGPFPAQVPFDLPTVTLKLQSGAGGIAQTATGGTSLTDPSWSWTRTDLAGDQRPFNCNPASPVVFTQTTITN